ncbi:hypothetical protein GQ53DRAFT_860857 [Thozetella sp. PMI_491]|nr:hypothetical protein GQ53DRAFT_860857 [Thozetella sp. PMI_491]
MTITKYKAAAVQAEPGWFDLDASVQKTINLINEAGQKGCKLIGFPETWIPGYPMFVWPYTYEQTLPLLKAYRENALAVDSEQMRRIRRAARDNDIFVSLGFSEIDHATLYMAQVLISPAGDVINHRRKLKHTHMEKLVFGDGSGDTFMPVTETSIGRLGQLCCWEHINPFAKALSVSQGEQVHVAAWPLYRMPHRQMLTNHPAWASDIATLEYSIEAGAWVIASFQRISAEGILKNTPADAGPVTIPPMPTGDARIFRPNGSLAVPKQDDDFDGLLIAEIDLNETHLMKAHADFAGHYMRPDLIRLLVDTSRKELITEVDNEGGIKSYTTARRLGLGRPLDAHNLEKGTNLAAVSRSSTENNSK